MAVMTPTPTNSPYNVDEIKRKALANIPLVNATPEKMNMYNQFQQQATQQRQNQAFAPVNTDQYKTQTASIDDIASKYGFDFSREYANRQAEAEAQARRNANSDAQRKNQSSKDYNLKAIDNNLMSQAEGLDRNYFQQYMQQQQSQVNGGMNGGIAADQDLRLAMSRQAAMGDSYRDANLGRMQENQRFSNEDIRLAEDLGLINQQGLARADSLFNDRLMQGADLAQRLDRFNLDQNQGLMNADLQQRGQNINIEQFLQEMARLKTNDQRSIFENDREFNRLTGLDKQSQDNWLKEYTRLLGRDKVSDSQWGQEFGLSKDKFDWTKYIDGQNLSLTKQKLANDKSAQSQSANVMAQQSSQVQQQWANILNEFLKSTASSQKTNALDNIDKYYKAIDQSLGGNLNKAVKYGLQPVPMSQNKNIDTWSFMKLMGG